MINKTKYSGKGFKFLLVGIGTAVVIFIGNMTVHNMVYEKQLAKRLHDLQTLTSQLETNDVVVNQTLNDTKARIIGLDMNRVRTDDGLVEAFFKKIFTWSSGETYNVIRKELLERNDVHSNFLTSIFPELKEEQTVDGTITNAIDGSVYGTLNMEFDTMNSYVIGIDDDVYSYFTEVSVISRVDDGTFRNGSIVVLYRVDKDGNITNLNGYVVSE